MTEEQWAAWDRIWREFQQDLEKRSTHGEFRIAEKSGHFIQRDQPEVVISSESSFKRFETWAGLNDPRLRRSVTGTPCTFIIRSISADEIICSESLLQRPIRI